MRRRKELEQTVSDFTRAADELTEALERYVEAAEKNAQTLAELERMMKHE